MPSETEIKQEMLSAISQATPEDRLQAEKEINEFALREDTNGKKVLQTFYKQWQKSKKKSGSKNPWNSTAAYLLGITKKQPNGSFFFTKRRGFARPSPPDIDSDFDYERRQEVVDYLVQKYGRDRVANIGTYQELKMKSCITRIVKALDIANKFGTPDYTPKNVKKVTEILEQLPRQRGAVLKQRDENGEEHAIKTTKDAYQWCKDFRFYMDRYPEIMQHTNNVEGLRSIFGVHASGIVISDVPLSQIAPLRTAKVTGDEVAYATQFAYEDLELLGLIKFDILAISTLTVIARCVKMVKESYGIDLDMENLPLDDKKTLDLYKTGKLTGVFQCESEPMQKTCMDIGVDRFDDIMAAISLFRPGPMDSIPEYCDRKWGRKKISYFHPTIEPLVKDVLASTYGILCYQEQVMRLCGTLGDMTPTEALVVIKGIGKKKEDVIEKGHKAFVEGAVRKGVPEDVAEQYWMKFITPFALYGFNASHACAYAYLSYQTAYLKANFPEDFMCSYLNVEMVRRKLERIADLEREAARMGIFLLPRDINKCEDEYVIVKKKDESAGITRSEIRPCIHCKGLPVAAGRNLVEHRPYASIRDVAIKTSTSCVDMESMAALCDAHFFKTKKDKVLNEFEMIREDLKQSRKRGRDPDDNIFG